MPLYWLVYHHNNQISVVAVVISGLSRIYGGLLASALAAAHRWVGQKNNPGLDLNLLRPVRDAMSTRKKTHDFIFPNKIPCCVQMRSI